MEYHDVHDTIPGEIIHASKHLLSFRTDLDRRHVWVCDLVGTGVNGSTVCRIMVLISYHPKHLWLTKVLVLQRWNLRR